VTQSQFLPLRNASALPGDVPAPSRVSLILPLRNALSEAHGQMPATPGMVFKGAPLGRKPALQFTRVHKHNITVVPFPVNALRRPEKRQEPNTA
jgi:hypothetical protein